MQTSCGSNHTRTLSSSGSPLGRKVVFVVEIDLEKANDPPAVGDKDREADVDELEQDQPSEDSHLP